MKCGFIFARCLGTRHDGRQEHRDRQGIRQTT
jgi:hypothetical protein